jgi:hypothetical protein
MADVERQLAYAYRIAVMKPAAGLERHASQAPALAVLLQLRNPEQIIFVRALDRDAQLVREDSGFARMVDMAVREQYFLDADACLLGGGPEPGQVAARIDEGGTHRLRAPQQGAILLKRSDGRDRRLERRLVHSAGSSFASDDS